MPINILLFYVSRKALRVTLLGLLQSVFDKLQPEEMQRARTRSNPFETIRGAFFLNRAAMKMANMDRVFDFMFTKPKGEHNVSIPALSIFLKRLVPYKLKSHIL